jgi:hypothetical protein
MRFFFATDAQLQPNGRLYRYYVSTEAIKNGYKECPVRSIPAGEVEEVAGRGGSGGCAQHR